MLCRGHHPKAHDDHRVVTPRLRFSSVGSVEHLGLQLLSERPHPHPLRTSVLVGLGAIISLAILAICLTSDSLCLSRGCVLLFPSERSSTGDYTSHHFAHDINRHGDKRASRRNQRALDSSGHDSERDDEGSPSDEQLLLLRPSTDQPDHVVTGVSNDGDQQVKDRDSRQQTAAAGDTAAKCRHVDRAADVRRTLRRSRNSKPQPAVAAAAARLTNAAVVVAPAAAAPATGGASVPAAALVPASSSSDGVAPQTVLQPPPPVPPVSLVAASSSSSSAADVTAPQPSPDTSPVPVSTSTSTAISLVPSVHTAPTDDRIAWSRSCLLRVAQRRGKPFPWMQSVDPTPVDEVRRERDELRYHAWKVHAALARYRGLAMMTSNGYSGPWVENVWIDTFARPTPVNVSRGWWMQTVQAQGGVEGVTQLAEYPAADIVTLLQPYDFDLFYPWVPLFAQWEDLYYERWNAGHAKYHTVQLASHLAHHLLKDVQYVTVVQRQSGFLPASSFLAPRFVNVLVLSAGGAGHVALPLFAQELSPLPPSPDTAGAPVAVPRTPSFAFLGKAHHHAARERMADAFKVVGPAHKWQEGVDYVIGYQPPPAEAGSSPRVNEADPRHWKQLMGRAAFNLAPRGTGPTSFRFYEALQMGTIPVYIHDGDLWLPYKWPLRHRDGGNPAAIAWSDFAVIVHIEDFKPWLENEAPRLLLDLQRQDRMREIVMTLRDSHFTYAGVMAQIRDFIANPAESRMRCHVGPEDE